MAYWEERALFHLTQEEWQTAFKSLFNAVHETPQGCPHQTRIFTKIAHLYFYYNRSLGDAEGYYKKALHNDPYYLDALLGLGDIEAVRRDEAKALNLYLQAQKFHPKRAEPLIAMGEMYYTMAKPHLAINAWEDALKIRPQDPGTLNNLGNVYYDFQNFTAALNHYERALKIEPSFYTAWNNLGNTQMELKDPRSAVESFKKSLKLLDEDPAVHGNLANAYFELRQVERAKFHLRKSLDLGESAVSHHNLAVMEKFTREDKNAGIHYGKALQIRPDYSSARRNAGFWRRRNRDVEKILEGEGEYQGWALRSFKGQGSKQNRRFAIDEARDPFWAPKLR